LLFYANEEHVRSLELLERRCAYLTVLFAWKVALSTTEKSKKGGGVCSKLTENSKLKKLHVNKTINLYMRTKRYEMHCTEISIYVFPEDTIPKI
jgi:hypothetical protein